MPNKKLVILCCDSNERSEIDAFISRKRFKANEENPGSGDDLDVHIIYPADVFEDNYMTYGEHQTPTEDEKEILHSLTSEDNIYIWGHGSPNDAYIPGAFHTEIADFLAGGINKENFDANHPLKINCEMCNAGRGGPTGESSFAGRFHSYLGKIGIPASVSGRHRNVVIDYEKIKTEGITTLKREYDGLSHLIKLPESFYKHQEPGSKVTYTWQDSEQVRLDSYRIILNKKFINFNAKLGNMIEPISGASLKIELEKKMLAVKLQINRMDDNLNTKKLKTAMDDLKTTLMTKFSLTEPQLNELGFETFYTKAMHQASGGGLVSKKTGVSINDPLLPNESGAFVNILKEHPTLKELSDTVKKFEKEFRNQNDTLEPKINEFIESLGSEDDINSDSLYASLFTSYRKSVLVENDGSLKMPRDVENIAKSTTNMLNKLCQNPFHSVEERQEILKQYRKENSSYFRQNILSSFIQGISASISGFFYGVKIALSERHNASLFESVAQVFKSGYEWATTKKANLSFYKDTLGAINDRVQTFDKPVSIVPCELKSQTNIRYHFWYRSHVGSSALPISEAIIKNTKP